jgi:hypothetical protein
VWEREGNFAVKRQEGAEQAWEREEVVLACKEGLFWSLGCSRVGLSLREREPEQQARNPC